MTVFSGVSPVLQLPLDHERQILWDQFSDLADRELASGASGLVVLGLGTECWTLTKAQRSRATRLAVEAARGRAPVIAGVDGNLDEAVHEAVQRVADGANALMVRPPDVPGEDLIAHFETLADCVDLPILVQDAPTVTGVSMTIDQIVEMRRRSPKLRSVKVEHPASGPRISALVQADVEVVGGWGGLHYLEQLRRGAVGTMPGSDLGPAMIEIHRLARSGAEPQAEALYQLVLPFLAYESQSLQLLIAGAKAALVEQGVFTTSLMREAEAEPDDHHRRTLAGILSQLSHRGLPGW